MKTVIKAVWHAVPFGSRIFSPLRGVLPKAIYQHMYFQGEIDVPVDANHSVRLLSEGHELENDLYWGGYEVFSLVLWRQLCQRLSANPIIDVGANTGLYSLIAKIVAPQAVVIGFEPISTIFSKFEANVRLNQLAITTESMAVSSQSGTTTIYDTKSNSGATLEKVGSLSGTDTAVVSTVSLDDYCVRKDIGKVDLIKIDVEGHEPSVLSGMDRTLASSRPILLVEVLDEVIGRKLAAQIAPHNYKIFQIVESGTRAGLHPCSVPGQRVSGAPDRNFVFCPSEKVDFIGTLNHADSCN